MIICYFCDKDATEEMLGVKLCTECKGKLDHLLDEKALDSLFNPEGGERPCALCISGSEVIGICPIHQEDIVIHDKIMSAIFDGEVIPKGTRCKLECQVTRNQFGEVDILKWKVITRVRLINSKKADNL